MENIIKAWGKEISSDLEQTNLNGGFIVCHGGNIMFSSCKGFADFENEIKFSTDTSFGIGSITKQFTAFCILKLVDEGKIMLQDSLERYISEYKYSNQLCILDLLRMEAGIIDYIYGILLKDIDMDGEIGLAEKRRIWNESSKNYGYAEVLKMVNKYPLQKGKKKRFLYSNTNHVFLQEIVERVSGFGLNEYLKDNIFKPLGMEKTELGSEKAKANSYYIENGKHYVIGRGSNANGESGIVSTLSDLSKWLIAIGNEKMLSKELWDILFQDSVKNYCVAWYKVKNWFYHGGDIMGYRTQVIVSLERDVQIVFCGNCGEESIEGGFFEKIAFCLAHLDIMLAKGEMRKKT